MAKGWKKIYSNSISNTMSSQEKRALDKKRRDIIRNTTSLSLENLKKEGDLLYEKRVAEEDRLVALVDEGKITKKELVEKAAAIKADREKKKNKKTNKEN